MKTIPAVLALALSALLLAGCAAGEPAPTQTPEFTVPDLDMDAWRDDSAERFIAAFPDIDTSFVEKLDESATFQVNGESWVVGSGQTAGGFGEFDTWARSQFTIVDDGDDRESVFATDDRVINLSYRSVGDGFLAYFFVSAE
jgi:hypothetical protein